MNPWLIGLFVAGGLFAATSSSSPGQGAAWPPSAAVQQALQTQIANMWQASGQTLSAANQQTLASYITTGISQYGASFPAGSSPTTDGFSAWMLVQAALALQQTQTQGTAPTYGTQPGLPGSSSESALSTLGNLSSLSSAPATAEAVSETAGDFLGFLT